MAINSGPRYEGKPLLRLLELYVLWAIDELPENDRTTLEKIAPKLKEIYGGDGNWQEAIATAIHMPSDLPIAIQGMWLRNQELARLNGAALQPQVFAQIVADDNVVER